MKSGFEQHSNAESLELYALGRMDEPAARSLEEHILICQDCRVRLDAADRYVRAMRTAAARIRQESVGESRVPRRRVEWFRLPAPVWATVGLTACAVLFVSTMQLRRGEPVAAAVSLVAERGDSMSAPAHRLLDLKLDARGLELGPQARVELVNSRGSLIEKLTAPETYDVIEIRPRKSLNPGSYYVRVYAPEAADPAREFALEVR